MSSLLLRRGLFVAVASKNLTRPVSVRFASTDSSLYEVREKPQSVSYFTGNYKYNDLLIELDALHKKYANWQGEEAIVDATQGEETVVDAAQGEETVVDAAQGVETVVDAVQGEETVVDATQGEETVVDAAEETVVDAVQQQANAWKLRDKMSQMLAIPLKTSQWRKIVSHLNTLASLPKPLPEPVAEALLPYRRYDQEQQQQTTNSKTLDALGRAYGVGRRKESSARCWVVEGDGQVLINGMTLQEYFKRPVDRDEVELPLEVTENKERYNVWALVNGGGSTGQAQALKLGIGRALLTHDQELKPILRKAGCITRDPRVVERKKEGQRKARARYTWVKR